MVFKSLIAIMAWNKVLEENLAEPLAKAQLERAGLYLPMHMQKAIEEGMPTSFFLWFLYLLLVFCP